jgi:hypothetical protein
MRTDATDGVLNVYIPFYLAPGSLLGGKKSVILHFLKKPSFQSASGLVRAILEGRKYLDTRRNDLDPWALLGRTLWSLAGIQSHKVVVSVYTNSRPDLFDDYISNYPQSPRFEITRHSVDLQQLDHPYLLTWVPRKDMRLDIKKGNQDDLFLYLEHDIDFRSENLNYFIKYREKLLHGITPGFMLVEWNSKGKYWSNFQIDPHSFNSENHVRLEGLRFIPLKQPYCPILLLDKNLADEFLESEYFELENFSEMRAQFQLLVRESAAIGLTYFGREKNYEVRSFVGFNEETKFPIIGAVVRHMPNLYADYDSVQQCKRPLLEMWSEVF